MFRHTHKEINRPNDGIDSKLSDYDDGSRLLRGSDTKVIQDQISVDDSTFSNPIEQIMSSAMSKLKHMVDTDTVVGRPIEGADGTIILPLAKVSMGFVAGGGEYGSGVDRKDRLEIEQKKAVDNNRKVARRERKKFWKEQRDTERLNYNNLATAEFGQFLDSGGEKLPFAGGSGGGMSVTPSGFLIGHDGVFSYVSCESGGGLERLIDMLPQMVKKK